MVYLIVTIVRFIIAFITTIILLVLFPIEIVLRLLGTILLAFGSRRDAEACWNEFPKVFQPLSGLWQWVFDDY